MSRPDPDRQNRQQGFLALDALVWMGAFIGMMAIAGYFIREVSLHTSAQAAGKFAAQVALAVRAKLVSENVAAVTAGATGTAWLRSVDDCLDGTAPSGQPSYLPICGFPDTDPGFGMEITTDIVNPSGSIVEATITLGSLPRPFADRYDLLQTMRRTVEVSDPGQTMTTAQTFMDVNWDADVKAVTDTAAASTSPTFDLVITLSSNPATDPYIRADGTKPWNPGVTQDLDGSNFINVGGISADGSAPLADDVEMARFVDSNDNNFLLDPHDQSTLSKVDVEEATIDLIKNDPEIDINGDGTNDFFLSNALVQFAGIVNQGATVPKPICPNGNEEIHGAISSIVATDNDTAGAGAGTYEDPKNIKGFAVYHDSTKETATTWEVYALAFIDDDSAGYELEPPSGLVKIAVWTKCSV